MHEGIVIPSVIFWEWYFITSCYLSKFVNMMRASVFIVFPKCLWNLIEYHCFALSNFLFLRHTYKKGSWAICWPFSTRAMENFWNFHCRKLLSVPKQLVKPEWVMSFSSPVACHQSNWWQAHLVSLYSCTTRKTMNIHVCEWFYWLPVMLEKIYKLRWLTKNVRTKLNTLLTGTTNKNIITMGRFTTFLLCFVVFVASSR